jgi:1,4-dihydroxy-2-naphthoate octaprenyltransferase
MPADPRQPVHGSIAVMANLAQWVEGARPRTLPNAVAPVLVGTGAAAWLHSAVWWKALLALAVSLALVVGVNYANDYSDGIRGTDDDRAGPLRLVGSKLASPRAVLAAAICSLSIGAVAGLALALVSAPWLIAVGAMCIAGAWLYTGGSRPYGYAGLGEVAVFLFFGPVAVLGTQYTQARQLDWVGLDLALATGALSAAVLVANNLRDIPTDKIAGKITLAVRLGDARTRLLYQALLLFAGAATLVLLIASPWCAAGFLAVPFALRAVRPIRQNKAGRELIPVLRDTGLAMLVWSTAICAALIGA